MSVFYEIRLGTIMRGNFYNENGKEVLTQGNSHILWYPTIALCISFQPNISRQCPIFDC